ncbi:hypothetical protein BYZ73_16165 [Rhodovulum viride]|uniref:Uncharacterized protein n=1 Tax=Rhodovulum viride TaxID=1231134 RepID=A0ABX9DCZ7_9RHOB|nr:hypothetical protein [Rhodovulum viride]RAP40202.1 hypothetical protein BYZ73_16165 [Rhodovulum viride]
MPRITPDRIEEIESLARHNCDELAGLTAELAELQARVDKLEGRTNELGSTDTKPAQRRYRDPCRCEAVATETEGMQEGRKNGDT